MEQIFGDRAKQEHHANRGHPHSNSHAQAYPMEAQTVSSAEPNHYHNQKHRRTRRVISCPLWNQYHGKDFSVDEDEVSSLTVWRSRDVEKETRVKPSQESWAQNCVQMETTKTRPKYPHSIPRQSERSQHRTYHWSRAEKTHPLLPLQTTWTYGERVLESSTEGHSPIFSQEMFLYSCTICRLTCCSMVHPRLLWDAILI